MAKPSDIAWVGIGLGVLAYELAAATRRDWELLSEAADRYRAGHPVLTHLTVAYVAGHLLRRWPRRADPLSWLAAQVGR